jgi:hypothetical protein
VPAARPAADGPSRRVESTLTFFRSLPPEAWSRRGIASGNPFTARALAFIAAATSPTTCRSWPIGTWQATVDADRPGPETIGRPASSNQSS